MNAVNKVSPKQETTSNCSLIVQHILSVTITLYKQTLLEIICAFSKKIWQQFQQVMTDILVLALPEIRTLYRSSCCLNIR